MNLNYATITSNTRIESRKTGADIRLLIDGRDITHYSFSLQNEMAEKMEKLLTHYRDHAQEWKMIFKIDLYNAFLTIRESIEISLYKEGIQKKSVEKRFLFLEKSPYFIRKSETNYFYYYQFQGKRSELGEIQYIFISIPKDHTKGIDSNFKLIKKGECIRLQLKERPVWFRELYNQAKVEVKEMHRLRKLFLAR